MYIMYAEYNGKLCNNNLEFDEFLQMEKMLCFFCKVVFVM